jgi:hypothetical protein
VFLLPCKRQDCRSLYCPPYNTITIQVAPSANLKLNNNILKALSRSQGTRPFKPVQHYTVLPSWKHSTYIHDSRIAFTLTEQCSAAIFIRDPSPSANGKFVLLVHSRRKGESLQPPCTCTEKTICYQGLSIATPVPSHLKKDGALAPLPTLYLQVPPSPSSAYNGRKRPFTQTVGSTSE